MPFSSTTSWIKFAAITGLSLQLFACGSGSNSSLKVTNGVEIADSEYPSVVYIAAQIGNGVASCTATFVNDSQVISAGHCVEGTSASNPAIYLMKTVNGQRTAVAKAKSWSRDARYDINNGVGPLDVSVITFAAQTAPATSSVAVVDPQIDDELTIVGYGNNRNYIDANQQFTGSGAGKKRVGTNTVANVTDEGMIQFVGVPEATANVKPGTSVLSGSGDSGGPLFIKGRLAGITSGGGYGTTEAGEKVFISQYVSLRSASSQALLKKALKPGTAL